MKKIILSFLAVAQLTTAAFAQQATEKPDATTVLMPQENTQPTLVKQQEGKSNSPYRTRFAVDGPLAIGGAGLSGLGLYLVQQNKDRPTDAELAKIDSDPAAAKKEVPKFDRFSAGYFSLSAKTASDYPFYGSFALPFLLLLDKDVKDNAGQVAVLYLETMALTGTLFTMTVAHTERYRPLVYNSDPNNTERTKKHAQNSFFAGHTAASASATFFAAKVFHDFNPDSELRPYVWGAAAAIPAAVGYFRLKAGKHFLSDNLIGYAIGAGAGILVPQLHKKGMDGLSVTPVMGPYNGMAATLTF